MNWIAIVDRKAADCDLGVESSLTFFRGRDENHSPRRMSFREPLERPFSRIEPLGRHPRNVRHHARALVRVHPFAARRVAKPGELTLDLADRDVLAVPLLGQCLRHDLPSLWSSSSPDGGPQLPAE